MRAIVLLPMLACASAPTVAPQAAPDAADELVSTNAYKTDYDAVRVTSTKPPAWMGNGVGCLAGQSTTMANGEAELIPAQLCVGIQSAEAVDNSTCHTAERQAMGHLGLLLGLSDRVTTDRDGLRFGEQRVAIAGLAVEASWRGSFRGAQSCAVQIALPEGVIAHLKTSWAKQQLVQKERLDAALVDKNCEVIEQVGEALAQIPGMHGPLERRIAEAKRSMCRSDRAVALDLQCTLHSEEKSCPAGLKGKLGESIVAAGLEQSDARDSRARFLAEVRVKSEATGERGKLKFCRVHLDFRFVDRRSGNAVENLVLNKKSGGLNSKQCVAKATKAVMKSGAKPLQKAMRRR